MPIPIIDEWLLRKAADILAQVADDRQLRALSRKWQVDILAGKSNRERIFRSLVRCQAQHGYPEHVLSFISACMDPVRFRTNRQLHARFCQQLNEVFAYAGLRLHEKGKFHRVQTAQYLELSEMRRRAQEAFRRLCGDEIEARLWKKLMRDRSYSKERFEADVLLNRLRQNPRPPLNDEHVKRVITLAAERQDDKFFKRLGKALSAKPKLPSVRSVVWQTRLLRPWAMFSLPSLVAFLLTRWTNGADGLPPLCFLTQTSLTDVCRHYLDSQLTDDLITKARQRLGLKPFRGHRIEVIRVGDQLRVV